MKHIGLAACLLTAVSLYGGESNSINISDLKEATYHLILDGKAKEKRVDDLEDTIAQSLKDQDQKALAQKKEIAGMIDKVSAALEKQDDKLSDFAQRAVFVKKTEDAYDVFIKKYVNENIQLSAVE